MNTPSEETVEDGNQSRTSSGSSGSSGKNSRHSIGITSSGKSTDVEGNAVPNYLRASAGSCHDFCKYGKHREHAKSAIPMKFKRTTVVNKEKVTKTVVPVEIKKTTTVTRPKTSTEAKIQTPAEPIEVTEKDVSLPSKKPQIFKRALSTNGKATCSEPRTYQRSTSLVNPSPVTVNRDASGLNVGIKKKDVKPVKKTEVTPRTIPVKKVVPKVALTDVQSHKASFSRAPSLKLIKYKSVKQVAPLKDQNKMQKTKPKQTSAETKVLHGIEAESEVKSETMELDSIHPETELIKSLVCSSSQGESEILHSVETEPEVKPETMEFDFADSSTELISPLVCNESEIFLVNGSVEEESLITHPVYESSELFPDELLEESSIAPLDVERFQSSSDKEVLEEEPLITYPVNECSEITPNEELSEESAIAPPVVEISQSSSEDVLEEKSITAPPVSEVSQSSCDEDALEDESEYTGDEEIEVSEEESENTDNEKEFATAQNDETETSVGIHNKIPRKGRVVVSEDKDDKGVKLKFRRGRILDIQSENNGPRKVKFRSRVIEGKEDGQSTAKRTFKNRTSDIQTDINGPTRLNFTKGKVMEGNEDKKHIVRRSFEKKYVEEKDSNNCPESIVLKHQGEQEKKDSQRLFNNVIEETASKFAESRKSKVKALVGAFETVISLQDGKPSST